MLFLLTWNAIFALVYYMNRPTRTLNNSTDFRLHQMLQKTTSRLIALYKDQLRWDLTQLSFRRNVDSKRRYQDTIRMGKAGEELKNLVTRSRPLESRVALGRRINHCVKTFFAFSPDPTDCPLGLRGSPFALPDTFSLYQLPMSPQRLSPVIDLTWLARMGT